MNKFISSVVVLIICHMIILTDTDNYFGQKRPGMKPEIFAPGIISTDLHNHSSAVFSPDYNEVYYSIAALTHVIFFKKKVNNKWTKPEVASFSGKYVDDNPFFSPDGNRLYYTSSRPLSGIGKPSKDFNIWFVDKVRGKWSKPKLLSSTVNQPESYEGYPSLSTNGDLYFSSDRKGGFGSMDVYISRNVNGKFIKAENLGSKINSKFQEGWPCISPDGNMILFNLYTGGKKNEGFAVSFKSKTGVFQKPVIIKEFAYDTRMPVFSPDEKFLFINMQGFEMENDNYSKKKLHFIEMNKKQNSWRNGKGNIVWISVEFLKKYRSSNRRKKNE